MITINLVFSEWNHIFKNPMTTLAALDRVLHHAVVLDMMEVESYRAKEASHQHLQAIEDGKPASNLSSPEDESDRQH